jgi:predicted NBD/HSP70 family sugar kinase
VLRIAGGIHHFLAVDVRPAAVTLAAYDLSGEQIAARTMTDRQRLGTPERVMEAVATGLIELCSEVGIEEDSVTAVGMAVPGQVDHEEGIVIRSSLLDWHNVDARKPIVEAFGEQTEFSLRSSAALAFWAELWRGHSIQEVYTGVFVDINESVETAIMLDGKLVGYKQMGSFGRMKIVRYDSARTEAWQDLVAVPALLGRAKRTRKRRGADPRSELLQLKELYLHGHAMVQDAIRVEAEWLAVGIANIFLTLGLPGVIIGGHIRVLWDVLQEPVFRRCEELTEGQFPSMYNIQLSSLTGLETLEGAALTAIGSVVPLDLIAQLTKKQKQIIESKVAQR